MRIGTGLTFSAGLQLTEDEQYRVLAQAGFDCVDCMIDGSCRSPQWQIPDAELRAKMEAIRRAANQNGITVHQTHAPFDCVWSNDLCVMEEYWRVQIQSIKATAFLGAPYMVMHPLTFGCRLDERQLGDAKQKNIAYFSYLKPYLKEYGVKVAIENIFAYDRNNIPFKTNGSTAWELKEYVDELGGEFFGVCLDVGHAALVCQDPVEMIYELGNVYLQVTHMHDNNRLGDAHAMPGCGTMDWFAIGKALRDIDYEGVFNYEAGRTYSKLGVFREDLSLDFLKLYAALAKSIVGA